MDEARFTPLGPDHLGALAVIAVFSVVSITIARRAPRAARWMRLGLAAAMVMGSLTEIVMSLRMGLETPAQAVPLELCDLSLFVGAFTLVTLSRTTIGPLYFFSVAGTVSALLTPELPFVRPTDFRFLAYFGLHGLTVIATLTLVLGFGVRPARGDWWRALAVLNVYAAIVAVVNLTAGTNYLYLRAKPTVPTLFDQLGPWPWYLVSLEAVAAAVFFVLELPFRAQRAGSQVA